MPHDISLHFRATGKMSPHFDCVLILLIIATVQVSTFSWGGCQPKQCVNFCKNGYRRDARGCQTCICKQFGTGNSQQCPFINCGFKQCPNGFLKDMRGCQTCTCRPTYQPIMLVPVKCKSLQCTNKCPLGRRRDNLGCETCTCKQTAYGNMQNYNNMGMNNMGMSNMGMNNMGMNQGSFLQSRCPYRPCKLTCLNGFKVDRVGCKICACRSSGGMNFGGVGGVNYGGTSGMNYGGMGRMNFGGMGGMNYGGTGSMNYGGMSGMNYGGMGRMNFGGMSGYQFPSGYSSSWTTGKSGFMVAPCPPGIPKVFCPVSPCLQAKCPRSPFATCVESYCGGCHAAFYLKRRRIFC